MSLSFFQLATAKNKMQGMKKKCRQLQVRLDNLNTEHKQTLQNQEILLQEKR